MAAIGKKSPMARSKWARGFTLIELMLVSAIIGLLASIALPKFANLINRAREAAFKGTLGSLRSALSLYYADNEGIYPRCNTLSPKGPGMYGLHGKYIDLGRLKISLPRYAANLMGKANFSGLELYTPTAFGSYGYFDFTNFGSNDLVFQGVQHWGNPLPNYFSWSRLNAGAVVVADIAAWPIDAGGKDLLDSRGVAWSTW